MTYSLILITALILLSGCSLNKIKSQKELEDEKLMQELESESNDPSLNTMFTDGCNPSPYTSGCFGTSKPTLQNTTQNDKDEIEQRKKEEELVKKIRDAFNKKP